MKEEEEKSIRKEFREAVNMAPHELEEWLDTEASRSVGQKGAGEESVGHASGRRIVKILNKTKDEYSESEYEHMRKVVGYVHRHKAQRPEGDVEDTPWRHSLMNWGHDPMK